MHLPNDRPAAGDFRTSPEFAAILDRLIEAAQASDAAALERILEERPEWRAALEAERDFLARVERARPAAPAAAALAPVLPAALHQVPLPVAQAWLAMLEASAAAERIEAAHFAVETCAIYLLSVAVGAYDAAGAEDGDVAAALGRLARSGKPRIWLDAMDAVVQWASTPAGREALGGRAPILDEIRARLAAALPSPAVRELADRLARQAGAAAGAPGKSPPTVHGFLETVLAHRRIAALGTRAVVRGPDAERTAQRLEAAVGAFLAEDPLLPRLSCAFVRTVERIGQRLFRHGLIDLRGAIPLARRGGLLLDGAELDAGRVYCLAVGAEERPVSLHPFLIFQDGKALRLALHPEGRGLAYSACTAGEGRIDRAARLGATSRIEALLAPQDPKTARPAELLDPGTPEVVGEFRILRPIGEGGMAIVYLAEQRSIGRRVALKVLHRGRLSAGFVERFRREGKAIGRLEHPHVVKVHSIGEDHGVPYLAMEYIAGDSLERSLHRPDGEEPHLPHAPGDRSPMESVCRIAREVALALDHAHRHGIVHRDVKPGNILLDEDGHAHLTDFGLAQERGKASITMTGDMVGTPHYLSPEQVAAKRIDVDHRTDIYSLGVTLYVMLTGRPPFTGETLEQILRQIALKEPTPPRKLNPRIPRDLETICLHAMEKDPDARYASAAQMAADLQAVSELRPILASRAGPVRRTFKLARRRPAVTALLVLLCAALVLWSATSFVRMRREAVSVDDNLRLGRALVEVGRDGQALAHFERVLELAPGHVEAAALAGRLRLRQALDRACALAFDWDDPGDDAALRQCLELLGRLEVGPADREEVDLLEAQVRLRLGRIEPAGLPEALAFLERLAARSASPGVKLLKAVALEALRRPEAAELRRAAEAERPASDRDRLVLAAVRMAEERWAEALALYDAILKRGDRGVELTAASQAARCCFWLGDCGRALEHLRLVERIQGVRPDLLRRRGLYLWRAGELALALRALDEAIRRAPDYLLAYNTRGHVLAQARRFPEALADLDAALARDDRFALAWATRAQVHGHLGDFDAAIRDVDRALQCYPALGGARRLRARLLLKHGNNLDAARDRRAAMQAWNKALADLERVLEQRPRDARALGLRAEVHLRQKQYEFALQDAERAHELQPELGQASYALGLVHYRAGDWDRALEHLDAAIAQDPRFPGALAARGHIRFEREQLQPALEDIHRALELEPGFLAARIDRAWIQLRLGDHAAALQDAEAVLARSAQPQAFLVRHFVNMVNGDWSAALHDCEEALALDPSLPETFLYVAQYYEELARRELEDPGHAHSRAVAFYRECLRVTERESPLLSRRGIEDRTEQARRLAARAFLRDGEPVEDAVGYALRGYGHFLKGDREATRSDLVAGTGAAEAGGGATNPGQLDGYVHLNGLLELARLAELLQESERAIALYRRVLAQDNDHATALDALRRLTGR
ncbi:MAG: tetratricopeptide repeat protein [Planctomycetes bacterium]|nr:tetratricopeptide repeat protein [Planctomycetota bacterium]